MSEKEILLAGFDEGWSYQWESFELVTKDLTEEEAQYQHPVYANEKQEEGWPPMGSILWQLAHLEYWYRYYLHCFEQRPNVRREFPPVLPVSTLDEAMERLLSTRATLRKTMTELPEIAFSEMINAKFRVGDFVRMILRHDTWHSSQISVARRLYRSSKA